MRTAIKALQLDSLPMPGDAISQLPAQGKLELEAPEEEKRDTGLLSMLAERFRESAGDRRNHNTLVVLPFQNFGNTAAADPETVPAPLYGFALADAIAARMARMSSLVVRPSTALMASPRSRSTRCRSAKNCWCALCSRATSCALTQASTSTGNCWKSPPNRCARAAHQRRLLRPHQRADRNLQRSLPTLQGFGDLQNPVAATDSARDARPRQPRLTQSGPVGGIPAGSRRALAFIPRTGSLDDLNRAARCFRASSARPGPRARLDRLGIAQLQYARYGLGGHLHVMAARKALDQRPRARPRLGRGQSLPRLHASLARRKRSARHGIEHLLHSAANDWNVHLVAGITLRIDGLYEEALDQFNTSLRLNPSNAAVIYNHRARVYQYQNQLELAGEEIEKG